MKLFRSIFRIHSNFLLLSLFLGAIASPVAATAAEPSKELDISFNSEFATINPIVNHTMAGIYVADLVMRPIIGLDRKGDPVPILITEVPTFENKKAHLIKHAGKTPGLMVDLQFLPNMDWSDGTPVTCEDLRDTVEIGRSPNVATSYRDDIDNIEKIEIDAKDKKNCHVYFREAKYDYYLSLPKPVNGRIEKKIFDQYAKEPQMYERNSLYVKAPQSLGLYNGPFVVEEIKPGSHVSFVPNPQWKGHKPYFQRIVFRFITNSSAIETNLLSGAIQMASGSSFTFDQALAFEKRVKEKNLPYRVMVEPAMNFAHVPLNFNNPILADKRVRQALMYSLNREEMNKSFFDGKVTVVSSFAGPLDSFYSEDPKLLNPYKYDKKKAIALLEEAGWKVGPDGIRLKDGKRLSLTFSTVVDIKNNELIGIWMQSAYKQIGVELIFKNLPGRVLFGQVLPHREFDLAFYAAVNSPNYSRRQGYDSHSIPTEANSFSGDNRAGWSRPDVDALFDQAEREFNLKKRVPLMQKIMKLYNEDLPELPLYYRPANSVVPKDLKGYVLTGHEFSEFLHAEDWTY